MRNHIFKFDEADLEAELDALGNELELDKDTSYLDEAIFAPSVPSREPGKSVKLKLEKSLSKF